LISCDKKEEVTPSPVDNNFEFEAMPVERPIDLNPSEWVLDTKLSDQWYGVIGKNNQNEK